MLNLFRRSSSLTAALVLAVSLACSGGATNGSDPSYDPGKLWVQPSPAILTPGATLLLRAVPEVHSEAPFIRTATWSVIEANGGLVQGVGNGETALYTAPGNQGTFHLKAVSEYGESRYIPQPGTVQVIDPTSVVVKADPASFQISKNYTGPSPKVTATITPLTNAKCAWTIVEPGFEGVGLIQLIPNDLVNTCRVVWNGDDALNRLPGNAFHIQVRSVEAPSAFTLVQVQVNR